MKTILTIALASILFGACKKCEDCTITVTTKVTGQQPVTATSYTELCGDELDQDGKTTTATATYSGYTSTVTSYTDCR